MLASGKKDIIKMFVEKTGIFFPASSDDRGMGTVEAKAYDPVNDSSSVRRVGAGFYHRGVSGGNGVNQRIDTEKERIVPGAHNKHHAVWRRLFVASGSKLRKRGTHRDLFCVFRRVFDHVGQFA